MKVWMIFVVVWDWCCLNIKEMWIQDMKFICIYVECDYLWYWWHIDEMMLMFMIMLIREEHLKHLRNYSNGLSVLLWFGGRLVSTPYLGRKGIIAYALIFIENEC